MARSGPAAFAVRAGGYATAMAALQHRVSVDALVLLTPIVLIGVVLVAMTYLRTRRSAGRSSRSAMLEPAGRAEIPVPDAAPRWRDAAPVRHSARSAGVAGGAPQHRSAPLSSPNDFSRNGAGVDR